MLTFKYLADMYEVPSFFIDVPLEISEASVDYVAKQLKGLCLFLEKLTGNKIDEEKLKERIRCGQRTKENYASAQKARANRYVSTDLTTPLYGAITNNVLLGTKQQERYSQMLLTNIKNAEEKKGLHLYWMHTIPFWSEALRKQLYFSERAQIVGCELAQTFEMDLDKMSEMGLVFNEPLRQRQYH